jgi:hypothetical protein
MTPVDVAFVLAFVGAFVVALVLGGATLEGIEARRESRRRNHAHPWRRFRG